MLAAIPSASVLGIEGHVVMVEVHVGHGLPAYGVVGLPDTVGRESKERVRAAILSSGLEWPLQRITVNLAPAVVRKTGAGLEAAIASGVLLASAQLPAGSLDDTAVIGELGLDGRLRHVPGILVLVDALARRGIRRVVVPVESAREAALVAGVEVLPAGSLGEIHACAKGDQPWADVPPPSDRESVAHGRGDDAPDLSEVRGLSHARRALAACVAGGHHLLFVGRPGVGKTMLARRVPSIAPPLPREHAFDVTRVHSAAGLAPAGALIEHPPFRGPHHSASSAALVGGGSNGRVRLGEITLAHRGFLFLDELGEFSPAVLDAMRQPLEDRRVCVARAGLSVELPADFVLVACSNPCPCGRGESHGCQCSEVQRQRYRRRLSAPLLDRFDIRLTIDGPEANDGPGPPSSDVRAQVERARAAQSARLAHSPWRRNADVPPSQLRTYAPLAAGASEVLRDIAELRALSARGVGRLWRVARTLADLDGHDVVTADHIDEASLLREDVL